MHPFSSSFANENQMVGSYTCFITSHMVIVTIADTTLAR
jgi:hypothetical protein